MAYRGILTYAECYWERGQTNYKAFDSFTFSQTFESSNCEITGQVWFIISEFKIATNRFVISIKQFNPKTYFRAWIAHFLILSWLHFSVYVMVMSKLSIVSFVCYDMNECITSLYFVLSGPEPQPMPSPKDDFIIGDRVWVGGTKPGFIAYIGETRFAPGQWAGVVLDQPVGKNDGSVAGVRYFQCETNRGVFSRPTKLTHEFVEGGIKQQTAATPSDQGDSKPTNGSAARKAAPSGVSATAAKTQVSRSAAATPKPRVKLGTGSTSNLSKSSPSGSVSNLTPSDSGSGQAGGMKLNLKLGDRVLVSGTKQGVLRFIGTTDFAKGEWAGVELDEPMGKNDGAVAGKRWMSLLVMSLWYDYIIHPIVWFLLLNVVVWTYRHHIRKFNKIFASYVLVINIVLISLINKMLSDVSHKWNEPFK